MWNKQSNVFHCNFFIFESKRWTGEWHKYCRIKLFKGAILHGASKQPEAHLEPSQTSARKCFLQKSSIVDVQPGSNMPLST